MSQQLELQLFETNDGTHRLNLATPAEGYTFTAEEVSNLISGLSTDRTGMLPAVPMEAPLPTDVRNVADSPPARWWYDEMNDRFALLIRHPGHGWLGYSLTPETMLALQKSLQEVTDHRNGQRQMPN